MARFRLLATVTQLSLILSLVLVLFTASAEAAPLVYVVTGSGQFGTVDLASGQFTSIGSPIQDTLSNLVWWKGSLVTLITSPSPAAGSLATINPATGDEKATHQITVKGKGPLLGLAFDLAEVRGRLYVTDFNNNIYSVDGDTGVATPVGPNDGATGMPPDRNTPLTFDPNDQHTFFLCDEGLYGVGGQLYATFDSFAIDPYQNPPTRNHEYVPPFLWRVDPFTGAATFVAKTDWLLSALVEVDGKAYAFRNVFEGFDFYYQIPIGYVELVTLDLATGKTDKLADVTPNFGPIFAAVPVRLQ
jgi:hypothetical protein